MDKNIKALIRNAWHRGYAVAQLRAKVDALFQDPKIERLARVQAWNNHDGNIVKFTKDRSDFIVPDGWPPGVDGALAHEEFVYHHFPEAKETYTVDGDKLYDDDE